MATAPRNVLFLCTGNTARSILAETILAVDGAGRYRAFSAGSQPKGVVNPYALKVLAAHGYALADARSKSWDEFALTGAPKMDLIVTVCDNAAGEACPVWPGHPAGAHWGIEDPAAEAGDDAARTAAFETAFTQMRARIHAFLTLDDAAFGTPGFKAALDSIGRMDGATPGIRP